jgi:hypothetical protein
MNTCDCGSGLNMELVAKPHVCTSCAKDEDPMEEIVCFLNRVGQQGLPDFRCAYYESREA